MPTKSKSNEIKLTRVYDAPVQAVWEAWTDPEQVAEWWGPRGFTLTTHSKDLRPGGTWRYTMHGPDGVDYPNVTKYYEVETCSKLVYDHGGGDDRPPLFRVTVLFAEVDGKTKMEMTMALATPEAADAIHQFIKKASGESTWDRLAEYLESTSSGKEIFVINRVFEAPLELMFEMWTDPKHVSQWLAPAGAEMRYFRSDIKTGGSAFYLMTGPGGTKLYGRVEYVKVAAPDQLVYRQQFCDESEKPGRHPLAPTFPQTLLTTVKLVAEGPDHTRVTVTWEPQAATPEELATFVQAKGGMTQGWTGSFDKLEGYSVNLNCVSTASS